MVEPNWPSSWTRAALELCVLSVVGETDHTHGYDVARRLQNTGLGDIKGGTLYPVLSRLEEQGLTRTWWVEGAGGPGRKLIAITQAGREALGARTAQWRDWSGRVEKLLTTTATDPAAASTTAMVSDDPAAPGLAPPGSAVRRLVAAQAESTSA